MRKTYNCEGDGIVQMDVLLAICGNDKKSMVDICSGECPNTRRLPIDNKTYIDIVERDIGNQQGKLIVGNIFEVDVPFADVSIATDCIEHFIKEDGFRLIRLMQLKSDTQIIFTPLGSYLVEEIQTDNAEKPDSHRSGWLPNEFEAADWATIVFPNFHPLLGVGAFFAFKCKKLDQEFERIINELNQKKWALQQDKYKSV